MDKFKVKEICTEIVRKINEEHVKPFKGMKNPLFLIATHNYPGVWLEHVYDAVFWAQNEPAYLSIAENTIELFIDNQTREGQYPCYVWDGAIMHIPEQDLIGYSQIQECVSFGALCLDVYRLSKNKIFLEKCYRSVKNWDAWQRKYRMTLGTGLVEMFVGYDTGHDNSGRLEGMAYPGLCDKDGKIYNASVLIQDDHVSPIVAVDMNANFYATQKALSVMAKELGLQAESEEWEKKAREVKKQLFKICYDEQDVFFYDVDKKGNIRKYLSSTIFHLFMEKVLDKQEDAELINKIYTKHIKNENEFWTEYPFPSMAVSDPSTKDHADRNCWGYFSQALTALRCTRWMDYYGYEKDFDILCEKFLSAWTKCYDTLKLGQELDPITGQPSECLEWYSSCMLFYLFAAKRLRLFE